MLKKILSPADYHKSNERITHRFITTGFKSYLHA
jgi:hypothetical protein